VILFPFPCTWDSSRYARAFLLAGQSEDEVQADTITTLGQLGLELWHTDAGGKRARGKVQRLLRGAGQAELAKEAAKVKGASCLPAGFTDLHGVLAPYGRAVYLEMKRPGMFDQRMKCLRKPEMPTPEQLKFMLEMHQRGAVVGVCWSPSDAIAILLKFLGAHRGHLQSLKHDEPKELRYASTF